MPHLTLPTNSGTGPTLDILVGVSTPRAEALRRAGRAIPELVHARALIDTGASVTCLDPTVLTALSLAPTGQVHIHTPSTAGMPHACQQFDVSIFIPNPDLPPMHVPALAIISAQLASQGIRALIGRDVLERCLLVHDGQGGFFSLAY